MDQPVLLTLIHLSSTKVLFLISVFSHTGDGRPCEKRASAPTPSPIGMGVRTPAPLWTRDCLDTASIFAQRIHIWPIASIFAQRIHIWPISSIFTQRIYLWPIASIFTQRIYLWPIASIFTQRIYVWPISTVFRSIFI